MLSVVDIRKRFGEVQALDGCSLSVARGRMLGFLGPNGAGKTTVMRAVFGVVEPDSGEVLWDGRPIGLEERLRFGYMPEERGLYPRMPVARAARLLRAPARAERRRGARRGSATGSSGSASPGAPARRSRSSRTATSSAPSSRRRCCTSRSCSSSTSRSPVSTPSRSSTLAEVLRGEAARGAAVLFSSHQLELVEDICEEVAIVDRGRVVATGNVDALRRASRRRRIELQLEGAPPQWLPNVAGVERRRAPQRRPAAAGRPGRRSGAGARRGRAVGAGRGVQLRAALARRAVPGAGGTDERPARDHARRAARDPRAPAQQGVPRLDAGHAPDRRRLDRAPGGALERSRRTDVAVTAPAPAGLAAALQRAAKPFDDAKVRLRVVASPAVGRRAARGRAGRRAAAPLAAIGSSSARTSTRRRQRSQTPRSARFATSCRRHRS